MLNPWCVFLLIQFLKPIYPLTTCVPLSVYLCLCLFVAVFPLVHLSDLWCHHRATKRWLKLVTVHWYKTTSQTFTTPETLLDEEPIRKDMANLKLLVAAAAA